MFKTRLISGIVMVALAIIAFSTGGVLLFLINALLSLVGMYELYKALKMENNPFAICGYVFCTIYYFAMLGNLMGAFYIPLLFIIISALTTMMIIYVLQYPNYKINDMLRGYIGLVYVGVMFSYLTQIRFLEKGKWLIWVIILSSWGCDTFAYLAGMKFGKHKLCSKLSPKKSKEGAVGGIAGAAILGLLFAIAMVLVTDASKSFIYKLPIICAIASVVSQFGDLIASGIKRENDVKDYGQIIPGHGGIMDRFDSVILVSPIIFYLCAFFF